MSHLKEFVALAKPKPGTDELPIGSQTAVPVVWLRVPEDDGRQVVERAKIKPE